MDSWESSISEQLACPSDQNVKLTDDFDLIVTDSSASDTVYVRSEPGNCTAQKCRTCTMPQWMAIILGGSNLFGVSGNPKVDSQTVEFLGVPRLFITADTYIPSSSSDQRVVKKTLDGVALASYSNEYNSVPHGGMIQYYNRLTLKSYNGIAMDSLLALIKEAPAIVYLGDGQTYVHGVGIVPQSPKSLRGPVTHYSITPDVTANTGLAFDTLIGTISGTPIRSSAMVSYKVVAYGPGGWFSASLGIEVQSSNAIIVRSSASRNYFGRKFDLREMGIFLGRRPKVESERK